MRHSTRFTKSRNTSVMSVLSLKWQFPGRSELAGYHFESQSPVILNPRCPHEQAKNPSYPSFWCRKVEEVLQNIEFKFQQQKKIETCFFALYTKFYCISAMFVVCSLFIYVILCNTSAIETCLLKATWVGWSADMIPLTEAEYVSLSWSQRSGLWRCTRGRGCVVRTRRSHEWCE